MHEPDPALGMRQGYSRRSLSPGRLGFLRSSGCGAQPHDEARDGGRLVQIPNADLPAEHTAQVADDIGRKQRVATEFEEVIITPDPVES